MRLQGRFANLPSACNSLNSRRKTVTLTNSRKACAISPLPPVWQRSFCAPPNLRIFAYFLPLYTPQFVNLLYSFELNPILLVFLDRLQFGMKRALLKSARDFGSLGPVVRRVGGWGFRKMEVPEFLTPNRISSSNARHGSSLRDSRATQQRHTTVNIANQAWPGCSIGNLDPVLIGVAAPTNHPLLCTQAGTVPMDKAFSLARHGFPQVRGKYDGLEHDRTAAIPGKMDKNVLMEIVAASNSRY
jgi:hypothetical protein